MLAVSAIMLSVVMLALSAIMLSVVMLAVSAIMLSVAVLGVKAPPPNWFTECDTDKASLEKKNSSLRRVF